uniref:Uncharacterized protein n=2 Tax=Picea TaxID=3328 RepID=A0A117NIP2_PICGL|nr:hypothetical protein ABT39_MTgene86 [Picea glauca]KUM50254.1 hypothetical protein ABT39_MTgene97 [Picea glauca]QHR92856.1 hypothetical protein Q903MT_gene6904 [Picea sitchensis]
MVLCFRQSNNFNTLLALREDLVQPTGLISIELLPPVVGGIVGTALQPDY